MKEAFGPIGVELIYGGDINVGIEPEETGRDYEENALIKARAWSEALNMPALADDSGLEVPALGGAPGVHSARAVEGSDADRTEWLLSKMEGAEDRRARFVSCIAVVFPDRTDLFTTSQLFEVVSRPDRKQKRITATGRLINNSSKIYYIVTGKGKSSIVSAIIEGKSGSDLYPASGIMPGSGHLVWMLDTEAASMLKAGGNK